MLHAAIQILSSFSAVHEAKRIGGRHVHRPGGDGHVVHVGQGARHAWREVAESVGQGLYDASIEVDERYGQVLLLLLLLYVCVYVLSSHMFK